MRKQNKIIIGALVIFLIVANPTVIAANAPDVFQVSFLGESSLPRGIRNNNPGNLKISGNNWQGKIDPGTNTDGVFEQFNSFVYGTRAMIVLLRNYIGNGFNSINKIINRYAPGGTSENNDVGAYVRQVAELSGLGEHQLLNKDFNTLSRLLPAMAFHENGREAITSDMFQAAWSIV